MSLSFRPLLRTDFALLQRWLAEPHVEAWWHEALNSKEVESKYGPRVDGIEPTYLFIIDWNQISIGWIQWYCWRDYPKHAKQVGAEPEAAGLDLAIGEKDFLGKGLGSIIILEFIKRILFCDSFLHAVMCDPEEKNSRSVGAFEKAGFIKTKIIQLSGETTMRQIMRLEGNTL